MAFRLIITPSEWMNPIILTVLALLSISILKNSHQIENLVQKQNDSKPEFFQEKFPESIKADMIRSKG